MTHHRRIQTLLLGCAMGALTLYLLRSSLTGTNQTGQVKLGERESGVIEGTALLSRGVLLQRATPSPVVFSPSGKWCVGGGEQLMLWNTLTGSMTRLLLGKEPSGTGYSIIKSYFISENDLVVVTDHNVLHLDLQGRVHRRYFGTGTYRGLFSPSMLPDGNSIAVVMADPFRPYVNPDNSVVSIRRLDIETGALSPLRGDFTWGDDMQMEMRKQVTAVMIPASRVYLLDSGYHIMWSHHPPHDTVDWLPFFEGIALTKNGGVLFILDAQGDVTQIETSSLRERKLLTVPGFTSVALSPNERFLAFGSPHGELAVYNVKTCRLIKQAKFPFATNYLEFSPNGSKISIGGVAIIPFDIA